MIGFVKVADFTHYFWSGLRDLQINGLKYSIDDRSPLKQDLDRDYRTLGTPAIWIGPNGSLLLFKIIKYSLHCSDLMPLINRSFPTLTAYHPPTFVVRHFRALVCWTLWSILYDIHIHTYTYTAHKLENN